MFHLYSTNRHQISTLAICAWKENMVCQDNKKHKSAASLYFYLLIISFSGEVAQRRTGNGEVSEPHTHGQLYRTPTSFHGYVLNLNYSRKDIYGHEKHGGFPRRLHTLQQKIEDFLD